MTSHRQQQAKNSQTAYNIQLGCSRFIAMSQSSDEVVPACMPNNISERLSGVEEQVGNLQQGGATACGSWQFPCAWRLRIRNMSLYYIIIVWYSFYWQYACHCHWHLYRFNRQCSWLQFDPWGFSELSDREERLSQKQLEFLSRFEELSILRSFAMFVALSLSMLVQVMKHIHYHTWVKTKWLPFWGMRKT